MKRKVIKQGHNTLTITLPKKWCNKFNVKGGDELDLQERGTGLLVNTETIINLDKIEIDVSCLDRSSILYYIRNCYRRGFDEIVVRFDNQKTKYYRTGEDINVISIIHKEVSRLVGMEIVEEKKGSCVIKELSVPQIKEFDDILRRIFLLLTNTSNDLFEGLKNLDTSLIKSVEEKHDTITKFISYCLRLLNKWGYYDYKKTSVLYYIVASLDKVADVLKYCCRDSIDLKDKLKKETISLLELINKNIYLYYELYYKFDLKKVVEFSKNRDLIKKNIKALPKKCSEKEILLLNNMEHSLEILMDLIEARMGLEI